MLTLRERRQGSGLSQRELARRAGVAYKTVQLLEAGGQGVRLATLKRLAHALKLPGPEALLAAPSPGALTAADAADRILAGGSGAWKIWLFEFVDDFRRRPSPGLVARAPAPESQACILALLASTVESLCAESGMAPPWWSPGVPPLAEPWFPAGAESLKASALVESPAAFRKRNIFVLSNFLARA